MKEDKTPDTQEVPVYKDRSLIYMGVALAVIILIMGYLTLFVDDPMKIFNSEKEIEKVVEDGNSSLLKKSEAMDDIQVKKSLVRFIEAYYYDQRKGYFDPPSYFAPITETFYNYHHLNYERLRDLYWKRLSDKHRYSHKWIVSTLDFTRSGQDIIATYWAKESYFSSTHYIEYSADVKFEMIINEEGKIISLRDVEKKNENIVQVQRDTTAHQLNTADQPSSNAESSDTRIYDIALVEQKPEFAGGQKEMVKYLSNNIKYPPNARQANVSGKVYLSFIVEKDGSINDIRIKQGIGFGCDDEAIRVLRNSPKWKPGTVGGNAVRTFCILPINFQLD